MMGVVRRCCACTVIIYYLFRYSTVLRYVRVQYGNVRIQVPVLHLFYVLYLSCACTCTVFILSAGLYGTALIRYGVGIFGLKTAFGGFQNRFGPEFALEDAVADALRRIRATTQNLPIMARVVDQKHYVYCRGCEKHRGAGYFSYDSDQCAIFEYSSKPQCEWPHWLIDHRR